MKKEDDHSDAGPEGNELSAKPEPENEEKTGLDDESAEIPEQNVESAPSETSDLETKEYPPKKKKSFFGLKFIIFILLLIAGGSAVAIFGPLKEKIKLFNLSQAERADRGGLQTRAEKTAEIRQKEIAAPREIPNSGTREEDQTEIKDNQVFLEEPSKKSPEKVRSFETESPIAVAEVDPEPKQPAPEKDTSEENKSVTQIPDEEKPVQAAEVGQTEELAPEKVPTSENGSVTENLEEEETAEVAQPPETEKSIPEEETKDEEKTVAEIQEKETLEAAAAQSQEPAPEEKSPDVARLPQQEEVLPQPPSPVDEAPGEPSTTKRSEEVSAYLEFIENSSRKIGELIKEGWSKARDYLSDLIG